MLPNEGMQVSAEGEAKLEKLEACKLSAYLDDAGIPTIGVGHTGTVDGVPVKLGMKITREKALQLLDVDLRKYEKIVIANVLVKLNQRQFEALVFFIFNTGKLWGTTILRKLNAGDYDGARDAFRSWKYITKGNKKVESKGLINRRESEIAWWNGEGKSTTATIIIAAGGAASTAVAGGAAYGSLAAIEVALGIVALVAVGVGVAYLARRFKHKSLPQGMNA